MIERFERVGRVSRIRLAAVAACAFVLVSGCVSIVDQTDWEWALSPTITTVDWDSGEGGTLLTTNCSALSGNDHSLVAGLTGFKERAQNLDRFIASLDLECTPYIQFGGSYIQAVTGSAPVVTSTISSNLTFRTTSGERAIGVGSRNVPIGIVVYHNNRDYVQNLQLIFATESNGVLSDYVNWQSEGNFTQATISDYPAIPQIGGALGRIEYRSLLCPSQSVITGMRIRQTSNGKIRFLGLDCRQLSNN